MFTVKKKIKNIKEFAVNNGKLIMLKNDTNAIALYDFDSDSEILSIKNDLDIYNLLLNGKKIMGRTIQNNGFVLNETLEVIKKIPSEIKIGNNNTLSSKVAAYKGRIKERQYGAYDIEKDEFLWLNPDIKSLQQIDGHFFSQSEFNLIKHNVDNGEAYWNNDLKILYPELIDTNGKVSVLGVFEDLVIIGLDQLDKLLALNIETGIVAWERNTLPKYYVIDQEKKTAHILTAAYKRIDINTGEEVDSFLNREYFEELNIYSQRSNFIIIDDHIITTDWQKGLIGAFNTVTHKFDWIHGAIDVSFPASKKISYCEPYLLIQDSNNSLHIFEKEQQNIS